jgi:hypothetical protein
MIPAMPRAQVNIRVAPADIAQWRTAARGAGLDLSHWLRRAANLAIGNPPGIEDGELVRKEVVTLRADGARVGAWRSAAEAAGLGLPEWLRRAADRSACAGEPGLVSALLSERGTPGWADLLQAIAKDAPELGTTRAEPGPPAPRGLDPV